MIKAIIFDCFGVLTTDKWKEFTASLPIAVGAQARDLNHAYNAALISRLEFVARAAKVTGVQQDVIQSLIMGDTNKNHALLDYIQQLKQTHKIGLLSNIGNNWIRDTFLSPTEQVLFDEMILSFEVGTTKPDPRIFEIACDKLGVEPKQAIFVDDVASYCSAAQMLGMKTVTYHDFTQAKQAIDQFLSTNAS